MCRSRGDVGQGAFLALFHAPIVMPVSRVTDPEGDDTALQPPETSYAVSAATAWGGRCRDQIAIVEKTLIKQNIDCRFISIPAKIGTYHCRLI